MMKSLEGAPVAVFDLDGCLHQGPYHDERTRSHLPDQNFWHRHWTQPDAPCHEELVEMARGLLRGGFRILILTARPDTYHAETVQWLQRVGPWRVVSLNTQIMYSPGGHTTDEVWLMMMTSQRELLHPLTGAEWKRESLRDLVAKGADIKFMVEDYKPNADVIREVVPVLLYERVKLGTLSGRPGAVRTAI